MLLCNENHNSKDRTGFCTLKNKKVTDYECSNCPVYQMDEYWCNENKILQDKNATLNKKYSDLRAEFRRALERNRELEVIEKKYNELIMSFWSDLIKSASKVLSDK